MKQYEVVNILDLLDARGRSYTERYLKKFSCKKNPDVEAFVRNKAISFAKARTAITYLVIDNEKSPADGFFSEMASKHVLGYFTVANTSLNKPVTAPDEETEKILARFSKPLGDNKTSVMATLLIAQFAKNDALPEEIKAKFKGSKLMTLALEQVQHLHNSMGGCTVFLECADTPALITFYEGQGFFRIGERYTDNNSYLLQYMKVLDPKNTTE